ncbi:glycosyltransferase family 4 protein [Flavobacterium sangjuense]|uniref:N-acetyl-alpha-D-glucosaminyl L-malate synthase n=1 Tax=Flavobacterium sangjuense TaxID=2518177 RepID=A0A4P7PVE1_9FLAO|nr:glycosyltransferase family 4 protein [Flavobacterium sangjuense]QBZ97873.1 N-acetyl-alpha-D-glucosaminyl L-malate synthase [Flavobacterium sangjuense]
MKILQIIQKPQFRGAEIFACQLSEQLQQLGHTVDVIFLSGSRREVLPFNNLNFLHLEADLTKRFWDFKAYKKLATIIKNGHYDIVQANASDTLKYAALSKFFYRWNQPLVFRNANKISDFLTSLPKKWINSFFINTTQLIASVSDLCKLDFQNQFPKYTKSVLSLPIGVSVESKPYSSWEEAKLSFTADQDIWIHVGSFVPEKNHMGLIEIFNEFSKKFNNQHLILIGSGKLYPSVLKYVEDNQITNIHFLGKRNDVTKILPLCEGLLLPSHIEGLPGVILEAMMSKIAVVAYNVGGVSEVVNEKTGYLINKNNKHSFVDAMINIKEKKTLEKIQNGFQLVKEEFSNEIIAKKFEVAYYNLLNGKN